MLPADDVGGNVTGDDEEAVTCEVDNHTGSLMEAKQDNQSRCCLLSNLFTWMEKCVLNILKLIYYYAL